MSASVQEHLGALQALMRASWLPPHRRLRTWRLARYLHPLTQAEAAKGLSDEKSPPISRKTYWAWEAGKARPQIAARAMIEERVGIPADHW